MNNNEIQRIKFVAYIILKSDNHSNMKTLRLINNLNYLNHKLLIDQNIMLSFFPFFILFYQTFQKGLFSLLSSILLFLLLLIVLSHESVWKVSISSILNPLLFPIGTGAGA